MRALDAPAVFENRPVYRLTGADLAGQRPALEFGLGRYFDAIDTGTAAAHEYAAAEPSPGAAADPPSIRAAIRDPRHPSARPEILPVAPLPLPLHQAALHA